MRPRWGSAQRNFTSTFNTTSKSIPFQNRRGKWWFPASFFNSLLCSVLMAGQSRKWMILVATIWIQAFTGTNFDFSSYSSDLKAVLGVSQVQLNYLATASDLGKLFGWSSGMALMYLPLWLVMFIAAFMGLIGYGVQWLVIKEIIVLPYCVMFLLCLLAGCSICWFNTVCFVLCIKNFPSNRPLALALTVSFNGVSAALYTLAAKAISPTTPSVYLLLNAFIPLITSVVSLIPVLRQPPIDPLPSEAVRRDQIIFIILNFLAVVTGLYLLLLRSKDLDTTRILFAGAIFLLLLPLGIPGIIYARAWFHRTIYSSFHLEGSGFILIDEEDLELHKEIIARHNSIEIIARHNSIANGIVYHSADGDDLTKPFLRQDTGSDGRCCDSILEKDKLVVLGEEHKAKMVVHRLDFWLYYVTYFCGGTIGLVYSNNIGQIAQSLGYGTSTSVIVSVYSSFSFFGRLLSAAPDFIRTKFYFARTGWLAIALLPTPIAFFLLAATGSELSLHIGTAIVGLSSGFIFAAAVSITSELFGPNSLGVNHNILITNIPVGSLLYGLLAAIVYDANATSSLGFDSDSIVCMGRKCYLTTFILWGGISILGLASSVLLFLRTRYAYDHFEQNRISSTLDCVQSND